MKKIVFYMFTILSVLNIVCSNAQCMETSRIKEVLLSQNPSQIEEMLLSGIDVNSYDENGNTLLFYTLINNENLEIAKALIENGADVNLPSTNGMTPLVLTVSLAQEIEKMQQHNKDSGINDYMQQAKMAEQSQYQIEHMQKIMELLLENGADVNQETPYGTPLMVASTSELNTKMIELLLSAGANVNQQDQNGRTALFYANAYGTDNIITMLLKAGASIHILDNNKQSYMEMDENSFSK